MEKPAMTRAQWLVLFILALLVVTAVELSPAFSPRPAQALENPIESRQEMVAELKRVNERLDQLIAILGGGKVKVTLCNAEELRGLAAPGAGKEPPAVVPNDDNGSKIIIQRKAE